MKKAIILAACAASACQPSEPQGASVPDPEKRAIARAAKDLKVGSQVPELRLVALANLPRNPKPRPVDDYCSNYVSADVVSDGARTVQRNGWIVTSETKLGKYDAITFVGSLEGATSGTCFHVDGNLGIFEGPDLKAIGYWRHSAKSPATQGDNGLQDSLGLAQPIDGERIRLWLGLPSPPFADVALRDGIYGQPVAKEDAVCGSAAAVPNVFGETIRHARRKLRSFGWMPVKPVSREDPVGGAESVLISEGVPEVEHCSGTGYGFCSLNYVHKKGFRLHIGTMGDDNIVRDYGVECSRSQPTQTGHQPG